MPRYAFLAPGRSKSADIADHLKTQRIVGVPYTDEQIEHAAEDLVAQARPTATPTVLARYPKAVVGDFDGSPRS